MQRSAGGAKSSTTAAGSARQSGRKRKLAEGVRSIDEGARREIEVRRLGALESDNYADTEDGKLEAGEDDEEYNPLKDEDEEETSRKKASLSRRKARAAAVAAAAATASQGGKLPRGMQRFNKPFLDILADDDPELYPPGSLPYSELSSLPSVKPSRHFCSVCGFEAPYTCVRCGSRFCSVRCGTIHGETRCLKWTV